MSNIIIDGYNVIGTNSPALDKARDEFISALIDYSRRKGHDITVVFDGYKEGGHGETYVTGGVKVVYTPYGQKADEYIKNTVRPGMERIVVSSDREIQSHAWAVDAVPVDSETFLRAMNKTSTASSGGDYVDGFDKDGDEDGEYSYGAGKRGNPRKTSKRQKAVQRAMAKL